MPLSLAGDVPVLETERLLLRGHRIADWDDCAALWADPDVVRYIGGRTSSREEAWARLLRYAGHWSLLGFGYWAVVDKAADRFVGEVGFADFKRDIQPPLGNAPEIGWILSPHVHGRGYATEAVRAALAWGETHLGSSRTTCIIHTDNAASLRVAEKSGYREERRITYKDQPMIVLAR